MKEWSTESSASSAIAGAVGVLRAGGLVAFPTETVYGLGADASNDDAVRRIFAVKGRPTDHPLIVHLGDADQLDTWAREIPSDARLLAAACWPGPLTLVLWRSSVVSDVVTGGRDSVGLRVPSHPVALDLLRAFGGGVAAPSANRFGRVSPTTAAHVVADLGDDVDLVLDGGACAVGVESTIVDLTGEAPMLLRQGGVSIETIEGVIGRAVIATAEGPERAPGMLAAHYAPTARVELVEAHRLQDRLRLLTLPPGTMPPGTMPPGTLPPGTLPPGEAVRVCVGVLAPEIPADLAADVAVAGAADVATEVVLLAAGSDAT
ncbi:MAG: threonylcarbamoyl-AMP synthase, partial [Actinobacteria bacterium]|nr:threonylcarbamoyl-AMP synthase [Actinomycetota bacterium]